MVDKLHYKTFLLFIVIVFWFNTNAQNNFDKIDSLKKVLSAQKDGTNKVNTLNDLTLYFLREEKDDSAFYFATAAEKMAQRLNYVRGLADAKFRIGSYYFQIGDYSQEYIFLTDSRKLYSQINDNKSVNKCYRWIGLIFTQQNNYADALDNYYAAYRLSENLKDTNEIEAALVFITDLLIETKNLKKALEYARQWEKYAFAQSELTEQKMVRQRLGNIYSVMKDNLAVKYLCISLHSSEIEKDTQGIVNSYRDLAKYYSNINKNDSAVYYHYKAINITVASKDTDEIGHVS